MNRVSISFSKIWLTSILRDHFDFMIPCSSVEEVYREAIQILEADLTAGRPVSLGGAIGVALDSIGLEWVRVGGSSRRDSQGLHGNLHL